MKWEVVVSCSVPPPTVIQPLLSGHVEYTSLNMLMFSLRLMFCSWFFGCSSLSNERQEHLLSFGICSLQGKNRKEQEEPRNVLFEFWSLL